MSSFFEMMRQETDRHKKTFYVTVGKCKLKMSFSISILSERSKFGSLFVMGNKSYILQLILNFTELKV